MANTCHRFSGCMTSASAAGATSVSCVVHRHQSEHIIGWLVYPYLPAASLQHSQCTNPGLTARCALPTLCDTNSCRNPMPHKDTPWSSWRTHARMALTTPNSSSCTICRFATSVAFSSAAGGGYAVRKVHSHVRLSTSMRKSSSSATDWRATPSNAGRDARSTTHRWYSVRSANCFAMATHTDTSMASDHCLCLLLPRAEPLADCKSASLSTSRSLQPAARRMCRWPEPPCRPAAASSPAPGVIQLPATGPPPLFLNCPALILCDYQLQHLSPHGHIEHQLRCNILQLKVVQMQRQLCQGINHFGCLNVQRCLIVRTPFWKYQSQCTRRVVVASFVDVRSGNLTRTAIGPKDVKVPSMCRVLLRR
ncbi:hypothetical protein BX661DRAFT_49052 [Kickxella alabastrina]|uniref:uncharacterized protein n=1 Tax=Kickxella alabastrina TaxID=61397 RepID=UPI002220FD51|nr:uncharacterized protein BX661DRAFT_49052 [Kickxella alabastrina]KAI7834059.1 hypothetical protein BX661DRAFT_49052 [Kickxella alabastrina]